MGEVRAFPTLETERLILRRVTSSDARSLLKYLSDADVMKYVGLEPFKSIEDALNEIAWYEKIFEEKSGMRWGITLKEKNEVIGSCGFLNYVAKHNRSEIGIELSKDYWGNGLACEAFKAVIQYGFDALKLHRIEALIEPENKPSQKLAEKQGFLREGLLRQYEYACGKYDDLYMYSLLKQEFFNE